MKDYRRLSPTDQCACKTSEEITENQGNPLNPVHVWMTDHVKLLKQALIQDFRSSAKFGVLSWEGPDLMLSSVTVEAATATRASCEMCCAWTVLTIGLLMIKMHEKSRCNPLSCSSREIKILHCFDNKHTSSPYFFYYESFIFLLNQTPRFSIF